MTIETETKTLITITSGKTTVMALKNAFGHEFCSLITSPTSKGVVTPHETNHLAILAAISATGGVYEAKVDIHAVTLGNAFVARLEEQLGKTVMAEIKAANQLAGFDVSCCASHDFCDPNLAMFDAFSDIYGRDPDLSQPSKTDLNLMNAAWEYAGERGLV